MKKGLEFDLEIENIKDDKKFNDENFIKNLQEFVNKFKIINELGFLERTGNLCINGQIIGFNKKELRAEYTLFKRDLRDFLSIYYKNFKFIDLMLIDFETLN